MKTSDGDRSRGQSTDSRKYSTSQVVDRLLHEAKPLAGLMTAASLAGTVGHLAATFLPVFAVMTLFALSGKPVWGMSAAMAAALMASCAVVRGALRYVEQYLNHNVAFRLLALFRSKAFETLRRLAPAKLAGHGKGDLIAMVTTDVELLEIFFAHTISPVVIAVATTMVTAVAALTLNPWMALLLLGAHLVIGVIVPRVFAVSVRQLGPGIRGRASDLDEAMMDDMRGLGEIIGFGCGEERVARIEDRTRRLWYERAKLSRRNGLFSGIGGILVMLFTLAGAAVALGVIGQGGGVAQLMTAFVLIVSSFAPTLALAALPANLSQTFASGTAAVLADGRGAGRAGDRPWQASLQRHGSGPCHLLVCIRCQTGARRLLPHRAETWRFGRAGAFRQGQVDDGQTVDALLGSAIRRGAHVQ